MWRAEGPYVTVTTAGTPVRVTSGLSVPTDRKSCQTMFIQQHASNTGALYLLFAGGSKTTGVGVLATIPAPLLSNGIPIMLPWVAYTIPYATAGVDASQYFLDADVSGDKATCSWIIA